MGRLLWGRGIAGILLAEEPFERIQTVGPDAFIEAQPLVSAGERSRVEAAPMGAAANLAPDQPGVLQRLDVLRGGCERDRKGLRQPARRSFASRECPKHAPTGGTAEDVKDGVELK